MKILHITPEAPGDSSGGKIGVKQTLLSLLGHELYYVGPEIGEPGLKALYKKTYELKAGNNKILRAIDSLRGHTNSRYRAWKALLKSSDFDLHSFDAVVMDFTKLDYVAEDIAEKKLKLIVRVHNVEKDYFDANYRENKSFVNLWLKKTAYKREKKVIEKAHRLIALTKEDRERLKTLYNVDSDKVDIIPVCIERKENQEELSVAHTLEKNKLNMLITGSLWFGPNAKGIVWFVENVYNKINLTKDKQLIIAGRKPWDRLYELAKNDKSIEIIASPDDTGPIFNKADIFIAPIFDGAGMKVKVAEALSYGLTVVGTVHALRGYKEGNALIKCYNELDFREKIEDLAKLNDRELTAMRKKALREFNENYEINISREKFNNILND